MSEFDFFKESYRESVNQSVAFVGQDLDFFTEVKADYLVRAIERHLGGTAHRRVLDVGCGHGFIHRYLRDSGLEIVGVDVAVEVLEQARMASPDVMYLGYDGRVLPFPAETFDAAFAVCVMHHVPPAQWDAFLSEMKRVVRPGGAVVIFEHNPFNPLTRYVVAKSEIDRHATLLSARSLRKLFKKVGFGGVRSAGILFSPFRHPLFRRLDRALWWCPLGAQYYAVARC